MKHAIGRWKEIRHLLEDDIASGRLRHGDRLPKEADLCQRFGVGRHSIRRAVAALAQVGKLRVDQGRGTFVEMRKPICYTISQRTRFQPNIIRAGHIPTSKSLAVEVVKAGTEKAEIFSILPNDDVIATRMVNFADDLPVNLSLSFHPAQRFKNFIELHKKGKRITEIYHAHAIEDYFRLDTIISARRVEDAEAEILQIKEGSIVLVMKKSDIDSARQIIGHSISIWPADHIQFALDTSRDLPKEPLL